MIAVRNNHALSLRQPHALLNTMPYDNSTVRWDVVALLYKTVDWKNICWPRSSTRVGLHPARNMASLLPNTPSIDC